MGRLFGLPPDFSAHGYQIDFLIILVHWVMLLLFVGWAAFFAYALVRFRRKRNPVADYVGTQGRKSLFVEAGVALFEVVLLAAFAVPIWAKWITPPAASENPVTVRVVAEQFAWNVHYPGADGVFGRTKPELMGAANPLGLDTTDPAAQDDLTTINQLHMPVDRPMTVRLSSKDVIHSFSLNYLRVKQDAVPGMEIPVYFTATETTPPESRLPACAPELTCWEIACAQLCGLGHFRMKGFYTVHSQEEFAAWLAAQTPFAKLGAS